MKIYATVIFLVNHLLGVMQRGLWCFRTIFVKAAAIQEALKIGPITGVLEGNIKLQIYNLIEKNTSQVLLGLC